jgi:membrane peptidoglycan carboxypeptidase
MLLAAGIVAALVAGWGVGAFVRAARSELATIPARVRRALAAEHSRFVPLQHISAWLPMATVAVEDRSFWTNPGVSLEGIARAALVDVASGAFAQGGSTITQQLVRDQLLVYRKTLVRKLREAIYAILLTGMLPKREILALYLNEVNYGAGALGVYAASRVYFHERPDRLTLLQSALLAGLPQDPVGLDPFTHPAAALARRSEVLRAMVAVGDLSRRRALALMHLPLGLALAPSAP